MNEALEEWKKQLREARRIKREQKQMGNVIKVIVKKAVYLGANDEPFQNMTDAYKSMVHEDRRERIRSLYQAVGGGASSFVTNHWDEIKRIMEAEYEMELEAEERPKCFGTWPKFCKDCDSVFSILPTCSRYCKVDCEFLTSCKEESCEK